MKKLFATLLVVALVVSCCAVLFVTAEGEATNLILNDAITAENVKTSSLASWPLSSAVDGKTPDANIWYGVNEDWKAPYAAAQLSAEVAGTITLTSEIFDKSVITGGCFAIYREDGSGLGKPGDNPVLEVLVDGTWTEVGYYDVSEVPGWTQGGSVAGLYICDYVATVEAPEATQARVSYTSGGGAMALIEWAVEGVPAVEDETTEDTTTEDTTTEDTTTEDTTTEDTTTEDTTTEDTTTSDETTSEEDPMAEFNAFKAEIEAAVGEYNEDANADFVLDVALNEETGNYIVTIKLVNITDAMAIQGAFGNLQYNPEEVELVTTVSIVDNALKCVTKTPAHIIPDGLSDEEIAALKAWENVCSVYRDAQDNEVPGVIQLGVFGVESYHGVITEDNFELSFEFKLKEGVEYTAFYISNDNEYGSAAVGVADATVEEGVREEVANGAAAFINLIEGEDENSSDVTTDDSSNTESETPVTGDAGIIVFAVLGILAVAGAAVVIKVRH